MELITFNNLEKALQEYGEQAVEIYRKNLSLGGKVASRNLIDSVTAHVDTMDGTSYEVSLNLASYWKYVEGGSQGTVSSPSGAMYPAHKPPTWAILQWINIKPVIPRPLQRITPSSARALSASRKPVIPTPEQLSHAIATNIEKYGIEPHPAMQATIDELNAMYKDKFILALSTDVGQYINKVLYSLNGHMDQFRDFR